ncbi:MAG: hypothetical protein AAF206_18255 [Bacteroidota bacterium]
MKKEDFRLIGIGIVLIPTIVLTHVFMCWFLPSEGSELFISLLTFWLSIAILITLFIFQFRSIVIQFIHAYSVVLVLIIGVHLFRGDIARQIWPMTQIKALVETQCPSEDCEDWSRGIEYVFPLVGRKVMINAEADTLIAIDYGEGRYAEFDEEWYASWVD